MTKDYRVAFYQGTMQRSSVSRVLSNIAAGPSGRGPVVTNGLFAFQLRDLTRMGNGSTYSAVLVKFRKDDLPHIGGVDGAEREIELDAEEGLLEKNHFLLYRRGQVLVYQVNQHGSSVSRLAEYLTECGNNTLSFFPIVEPDALERLIRGQGRPISLEIGISQPSPTWLARMNRGITRPLIQMLGATDGASLQFRIKPRRRGFLSQDVRQLAQMLVQGDDDNVVTKARVELENEDGESHLIDLVADRIKESVTVEMAGRYPIPEAMFQGLSQAYDRRRAQILEIVEINEEPGD